MRFNSLFTVGGAFAVAIGGAAAISPVLWELGQSSDVGATEQKQKPTVPDGAAYRPEFLDPDYWHPKNKNFEIIDWEKWKACNPFVPFQYDNPLREAYDMGEIFDASPIVQWGRQDQFSDEIIATGAKPMVGTVTDPEMGLFKGLLGPHPDSSVIPEPFRNKLIWMADLFANEYLASFNRGAWRTNTPEGRAIGVMPIGQDWTFSTTQLAFNQAVAQKDRFMNFQMSPDGKWIKFFSSGHPNDPEAEGTWGNFYIVQEGDVFTDRDGTVLEWVKPGDTYRISTLNQKDPYFCKEEDIRMTYFPRVVATLDEETGDITTVPRNYDDLFTAVTVEVPAELEVKTNGFTTSENLSVVEKHDFIEMYEPDRQMYLSAPEPPYGDVIENIGVTPTTAKSKSKATKSVGKGKSGGKEKSGKVTKRNTGDGGKLPGKRGEMPGKRGKLPFP